MNNEDKEFVVLWMGLIASVVVAIGAAMIFPLLGVIAFFAGIGLLHMVTKKD